MGNILGQNPPPWDGASIGFYRFWSSYHSEKYFPFQVVLDNGSILIDQFSAELINMKRVWDMLRVNMFCSLKLSCQDTTQRGMSCNLLWLAYQLIYKSSKSITLRREWEILWINISSSLMSSLDATLSETSSNFIIIYYFFDVCSKKLYLINSLTSAQRNNPTKRVWDMLSTKANISHSLTVCIDLTQCGKVYVSIGRQ